MKLESCFQNGEGKIFREFEFRNTREGFHEAKEEDQAGNGRPFGTKVLLADYKLEYQKHAPRPPREIAREIIPHFQLYFIQGTAPKITIENQNNDFVDLQTVFSQDFQSDIQSREFVVAAYPLKLYLSKSVKATEPTNYSIAHIIGRSLLNHSASKIIDLGKYSIKSDSGNFYYQAFVLGMC